MLNDMEFLALARLASWLDFPVGVLEEEGTKIFTLVIDFPTGAVSKRIPKLHMYGVWHHMPNFDRRTLPKTEQETIDRLQRIIFGVLGRTIHTIPVGEKVQHDNN